MPHLKSLLTAIIPALFIAGVVAASTTISQNIVTEGDLTVGGNVGVQMTSNISDALSIFGTIGLAPDATTSPDVRLQRGGASNLQFIGAHTISTSTGDLTIAPNSSQTTVTGNLTSDTLEHPCPTEWLWVPGSAKHGTLPGFCVMKWEAKDVSGTATFQSAQTPWVSISWRDAKDECRALDSVLTGTGYHLITDPEWLTIAENIAYTASNWADSTIGSTVSGGGGLFRGNVNLDDSASCGDTTLLDGDTAGVNCLVGGRNKRMHTLSNGEDIWDVSGNIVEWTDRLALQSDVPSDATPAAEWLEYTAITTYNSFPDLRPPHDLWNSSYGVGQIFSQDTSNTATRAFLRGGGRFSTTNAGIFTLNLDDAPTRTSTSFGFRCAR